MKGRTIRTLEEHRNWDRWLKKNPDFDTGTWDALNVEEKRKCVRTRLAPPKSISTWRDERAGNGTRMTLFRTRKRSGRCAVVWHTPPKRVGPTTIRLPGLKPTKGLPSQVRLRAAKICAHTGRGGKPVLRLHIAVDVEQRKRHEATIVGNDAGCANTLINHDGWRLTLPEHNETLAQCVEHQRQMARCEKGSRKWSDALGKLRGGCQDIRNADHDAIRKATRELALMWDVLGLETLRVVAMGTSARARGRPGVSAKSALNRKLRRALWGFTRATLETAFETAGGEIVYIPAAYSSQTCSRCGHIDAKNRNSKDLLCMDCAHVDDTDENATCNIRQRTIEILMLRAAGHSPTKALNLLWKDILTNTKRYAKNARNTRTLNSVAREGENQPSGGQRPTHHAAGRVPHQSAIAGEKRQTGPQAGLLSNAQHLKQQRHKNSITSV